MPRDFDFAGALGDAGKGVAAGAPLGPVGMAAGGLIGLGVSIAPEIGKWLGGEQGEETGRLVTQAIQQATGTGDPDVAGTVLADPLKATAIRVQLAQIAADREAEWRQYELDALKSHLADTQDARAMSVAMAKEHSPLAYGAAVVTVVLLSAFIFVIVMNPPMDEGMKETLKVLTVAAASYWIGSSRGSAAKDTIRPADAGTR